MLERIAHAKINLALHVIGQRSDGFHLLDSLVAFTQFGDVICVKEADNPSSLVSLSIDGPFSNELQTGANNLVSRAALALGYQVSQKHEKPKPVEIKLTKNLPVASGIGGGSADAGATLLALWELWDVGKASDIELEKIALELGADIPMCLHSKPLRAQGIGDEITLLESNTPFHIVLVNPGVEVSTPEIFKRLIQKNNTAINRQPMIEYPSIYEFRDMRNDLQNHAIEIEPVIQETLETLQQTNPQFMRMSGSGATCFGIYDNQKQANQAVNQIKSQHPDWWCVATATTVS